MHLDWECFEDLVKKYQLRSAPGGVDVRPGLAASAERGEDGELLLHFTSNSRPQMRLGGQAGVVRMVSNEIALEGLNGVTGVARNATFSGLNISQEEAGERVVETFRPGEIELRFTQERPVATVIDWVENLDTRGAHYFGEQRLSIKVETQELRFGDDGDEYVLSNETRATSTSYGALRLDMPTFTAWLDELRDIDGVVRPGRIVYHGSPSADDRRRFREVLGFALGNCLIHRGSTAMDQEGYLRSTTAIASNPFGSRIFALYAQPPAPLGASHQLIEQTRLQPIVRFLLDHYDELGFRSLSWAYWHAICAPLHAAPVQFGGAIEMLRASYIEANPQAISRTVLPGEAWHPLAHDLKRAINAREGLDSSTKGIFNNKIDNLNAASGALLFRRFMEVLNLNQGGADVAAWRRRNQSAHGHVAAPEDAVGIVRDTKLLRTLLNRMILRIAGAADAYIDQFTIGYPTRSLEDGVPEEILSANEGDAADR